MTHENNDYRKHVQARIEASLSSGHRRLIEIVRCCRGAYPSVVRDALAANDCRVHEDTCNCYSNDGRFPPAGSGSILSQLEGNPILHSWYFTDGCCERIQHIQDWSQKKLAFLGTPRLFEWFRENRLGRQLVLFEIDTLVVTKLNNTTVDNCSVVLYDIDDELPSKYRHDFDCVFTDPPWYVDHYHLWISRAASLIQNGQLFISLFPELLRPSGPADRAAILEVVRPAANSMFLLQTFLEYEVPSFERNELQNAGFTEIEPWKLADLLIAHVASGSVIRPFRLTPEWHEWAEVDVGQTRIFVNATRGGKTGSLLSPPASGRTILESPSRRNPVLREVNVLTSRGHGLLSGNPSMLSATLRQLNGFLQSGLTISAAVAELHLGSEVENLLLGVLG